MPTYQYACTACEHRFEAVQSFSDASLTECPQCAGKLRKVFSSVGIVFKGSGFYRTDSRAGASSVPGKDSGSSTSESGSGSSGDSPSSGSSEKSDTKSDKSSTSSGSSEKASSSSASTTTKAAST